MSAARMCKVIYAMSFYDKKHKIEIRIETHRCTLYRFYKALTLPKF